MAKVSILSAIFAVISVTSAQCGSGQPQAIVDGAGSSYTATKGGAGVYSGPSYFEAINAALTAIGDGERVVVLASGNIGPSTIRVTSGKTFEVCGTITAEARVNRGAIEAYDATNVKIPYLKLAGSPVHGMRFYGVTGLALGQIEMNLKSGLGIRFERDKAPNKDVSMDVINVTGASSHAVETWNIDGLTINSVIAKNVGECGLLLQTTTNANVKTVDCDNAGANTGYACLRFANKNGARGGSDYTTNVIIDSVKAIGGGRGLFCVSQSGGAEIGNVDFTNTGSNAVLIENCYNINIVKGTVKGGGQVRLSGRAEFPGNSDISINLKVDGTDVMERPCGTNIKWAIAGSAKQAIC
ncbi:unnamed protein product [Diplocarpon coronariae]|uniref:Ricin B lectin n=1 Tax=Diplocarpon coronariae TaxID=2795749 RepID=A0A218Z3X7_9HELO|nr:ricin B lectin [Marssonina coronariae]